MTTPAAFIDDGYTLEFSIPEIPDVSIGIKGQYRPFTALEKAKLSREWDRHSDDPDKIDKATCEAIAKHLVEWDLVDRDGKDVPISAASISRLYPSSLINRLLDTVTDVAVNQMVEVRAVVLARDTARDIDERVTEFRALLESIPATVDVEAAAIKN